MKTRQDQLHFNLFSKDKRRSDKDSTGREKMELNKPVSLVMFTADKNQSLKLPPSLFTIKKLHQHFSKSPNPSCPDADWWNCIPSSGSWTLQISQSWTIPSDTFFLTFFFSPSSPSRQCQLSSAPITFNSSLQYHVWCSCILTAFLVLAWDSRVCFKMPNFWRHRLLLSLMPSCTHVFIEHIRLVTALTSMDFVEECLLNCEQSATGT